MGIASHAFPPQMLSMKEKMKVSEGEKVPNWIKKVSNFFAAEANLLTAEKVEMSNLYKIADGLFDETDYKYVENPFNTKNKKYQKYPAKLRNYDIIGPIIDRLMGERREMPFRIIGRNKAITRGAR